MNNNLTAEQELTDDREIKPETPTIEQGEPVSDAVPAEKKKFSPIIKVDLTEEQENKIIELIKSEHTKILAEYEAYNNGEGWFAHIDKTNRIIESAKEISDTGENVRELGIAQIAADVVASKD
jgi:hypothetical protein